MKRVIIEAPVYTVEAALVAAEAGVDRLELCADFGEGGVTPSAGMVEFLKEALTIPLQVMIRPRGGDFVYGSEEIEVMRRDIVLLRSLGADGFVFGCLDAGARVDSEACRVLIDAAEGAPCTFHRAFDVALDQIEAIERIVETGLRRILTSGAADRLADGIANVARYVAHAAGRIIIMPGGGLEPALLPRLFELCELEEIHASCRAYRPSRRVAAPSQVRLSQDPQSASRVLTVDPDCVRTLRRIVSASGA